MTGEVRSAIRPFDVIVVRGIKAIGRHGVLGFERERGQPFEVDLEMELDLSQAAADDDLSRTADYGAIVGEVVRLVETTSFRLLEALAAAVASTVLATTPAQAVTVEVRKVRPPVAAHVDSVGVRIHRSRPR